jgi:peroxiredoxin
MARVLMIAAAFHMLWGLSVALFPNMFFDWAGIAPPLYPEFSRCIGIVVAIFGIGCAIASTEPVAHWSIVLMGLIGALLGPACFLQAALSGRLPAHVFLAILSSGAIWWLPFSWILYQVYLVHLGREREAAPEIQRMAMKAHSQLGPSIAEFSQMSPVLLVFQRHTGCTFCREALADLAARLRDIERNDTMLVLVHMSSEAQAHGFFRKYGLENVPRVSDPQRTIYRAFGLGRGSFLKLFGPKVWIRGFEAGVLHRHGLGRIVGDGFQMPGVFLIFHGTVLRSYRHQSAADRPDYVALTSMDAFPEWERR